MPENQPIKITRSAGQNWAALRGNSSAHPSGTHTNSKNTASPAAAAVEAVTGSLGGMDVSVRPPGALPGALPMALVDGAHAGNSAPDLSEILVTRGAGLSWPARFSHASSTGGPTLSDIDTLTGSISGLGNAGSTTPIVNAAPATLTELIDVAVANLSAGDVLRYADNKWRNYNETQLTDGGNF